MATCVNCGRALDSVGSEGLCENCMPSSGHGRGTGTPEEVPCQRCGMYLPPHELQMWNSRLYCAYCIMDIRDEEKMGKEKRHEPHAEGGASQDGGAGGLFGSGKNDLQQYPSHSSGTCERCGRQADTLYTVGGIRLCQHCRSEGGGESPSRPSRMGQIVERMKSYLKINSAPRPAQKEEAKLVFDVRSRKMVERKAEGKQEKKGESMRGGEEPQGGHEKGKAEPPAPWQGSWKAGASPPAHGQHSRPSGVFDTRDRKLIEKKEGMEGQQPISEGKRDEKKPNAKAKKFFFKLHPASPKKK